MKKLYFAIFFLIFLFIGFLGLVYKFFPQIGFFVIANNHYKGEWYDVGEINTFLVKGEKLNIKKRLDHSDDHKWQEFHIKDYLLTLPVNHPLFWALPIIEIESKNFLQLGVEFRDQKGKTLLRFRPSRTIQFDFLATEQKLFDFAWTQKIFSRVDYNTIWKDLFSLQIPRDIETVYSKNSLRLIYFLYQIAMRKKFFGQEVEQYYYNEKKNYGIVTYRMKDDDLFVKERIYFYIDGIIENFTIETRMGDYFSEDLRVRILNNVAFKNSSSAKGKRIYKEFMDLKYSDKISMIGMYYLYSSWSHDVENKDFLKSIISLLERRKGNIAYITPFYSYSFKKYGTNFSTNEQTLKESQDIKLNKKIREEDEFDLNQIGPDGHSEEGEGSARLEEKIKYHLEKAKEGAEEEEEDQTSISFD